MLTPGERDTEGLLSQCRWPPLAAPYDGALHEAVAFILQRFDVLGIIASGTIIRGNPGPSSDLDIYVIHAKPKRQRLQKFFDGVPAEIFVNPVSAIEGYFRDERKEGRPLTAHMLAAGFVILDRDPVVEQLRQRAQALLVEPPDPHPTQRTMLRYGAALQYEDALDIASASPAGANMILSSAVYAMLQYRFWKANRYLPRDKDLLDALSELDPDLAAAAGDFYATAGLARRLALAEEIVDRTIEARGFFEWESELEEVKP